MLKIKIPGTGYIEYENTSTGLKILKNEFINIFINFETEPNHIDNDFLKILKSIQLVANDTKEAKKKAYKGLFGNPEMMKAIILREEDKAVELLFNSDNIDDIIDGLVDSNEL